MVGRMAWWDGMPLAESDRGASLLKLQGVVEHNKAKEEFILPYLLLCQYTMIGAMAARAGCKTLHRGGNKANN